ncbi:MAG: exodeoxyribonuclease III [Candidatus Enterosoma sp.]|nr:exodeoxyribonuclease III [Bacilli bacterium]MDY3046840.1 exodeoxyribonuclease III [Candidatus Enterosoma sp.]
MTFLSFNVNSIKAYLGKDLLSQWLPLSPDFISIEELKLSEKEHKDFPFVIEGYTPYWTVSKVKKGYSGTAILTKRKPLSVHYGLIDGKYDEEGRATTLEFENFYYVTLYVPNSGEELKRLNFRMQFEKDLREYLTLLKNKKPVIVTGDLNVAHNEIDLKNPSTNHHSAGFTDEERREFSKLLDLGFVDTFRKLHPEEKKYSYWSYFRNARKTNAGWRLDYMLVTEDIFPLVKRSEILNDVFGSDHCPVLLDIDLK